jgi:hypothetical protein
MCAGRYGRPQWARWCRRGDEREKTVKKTKKQQKNKKILKNKIKQKQTNKNTNRKTQKQIGYRVCGDSRRRIRPDCAVVPDGSHRAPTLNRLEGDAE